jgi:hypothetical protein
MLADLAHLREATRIRVTAEEKPEGDGQILAFEPETFLGGIVAYSSNKWSIVPAMYVRLPGSPFTNWAPLPERPAR